MYHMMLKLIKKHSNTISKNTRHSNTSTPLFCTCDNTHLHHILSWVFPRTDTKSYYTKNLPRTRFAIFVTYLFFSPPARLKT